MGVVAEPTAVTRSRMGVRGGEQRRNLQAKKAVIDSVCHKSQAGLDVLGRRTPPPPPSGSPPSTVLQAKTVPGGMCVTVGQAVGGAIEAREQRVMTMLNQQMEDLKEMRRRFHTEISSATNGEAVEGVTAVGEHGRQTSQDDVHPIRVEKGEEGKRRSLQGQADAQVGSAIAATSPRQTTCSSPSLLRGDGDHWPGLKVCEECGRRFNPSSLEKHRAVCRSVFGRTRVPFESSTQRLRSLPQTFPPPRRARGDTSPPQPQSSSHSTQCPTMPHPTVQELPSPRGREARGATKVLTLQQESCVPCVGSATDGSASVPGHGAGGPPTQHVQRRFTSPSRRTDSMQASRRGDTSPPQPKAEVAGSPKTRESRPTKSLASPPRAPPVFSGCVEVQTSGVHSNPTVSSSSTAPVHVQRRFTSPARSLESGTTHRVRGDASPPQPVGESTSSPRGRVSCKGRGQQAEGCTSLNQSHACLTNVGATGSSAVSCPGSASTAQHVMRRLTSPSRPLEQCPHCARSFRSAAIDKHVKVCQKVFPTHDSRQRQPERRRVFPGAHDALTASTMPSNHSRATCHAAPQRARDQKGASDTAAVQGRTTPPPPPRLPSCPPLSHRAGPPRGLPTLPAAQTPKAQLWRSVSESHIASGLAPWRDSDMNVDPQPEDTTEVRAPLPEHTPAELEGAADCKTGPDMRLRWEDRRGLLERARFGMKMGQIAEYASHAS